MEGYYSAVAQAKQMLGKGLVSLEEYAVIDTIMAEKYGFSSCSLFRDNDLLYRATDGNIVTKPKQALVVEEVTKWQKQ